MSKPKEYTKAVLVRLTSADHKRWIRLARQQQRSMAAMARIAVEQMEVSWHDWEQD
jgi:predicted transcriptional regulator